jgi:hypothetical protein
VSLPVPQARPYQPRLLPVILAYGRPMQTMLFVRHGRSALSPADMHIQNTTTATHTAIHSSSTGLRGKQPLCAYHKPPWIARLLPDIPPPAPNLNPVSPSAPLPGLPLNPPSNPGYPHRHSPGPHPPKLKHERAWSHREGTFHWHPPRPYHRKLDIHGHGAIGTVPFVGPGRPPGAAPHERTDCPHDDARRHAQHQRQTQQTRRHADR